MVPLTPTVTKMSVVHIIKSLQVPPEHIASRTNVSKFLENLEQESLSRMHNSWKN